MYQNYGDRDFFEHGVLINQKDAHTFEMLRCKPYSDQEDLFMFAHLEVDTAEEWIDKIAVMSYIGMNDETFDPYQYAIGCTDYYDWENFGANNYVTDWRKMTREEIEQELSDYFLDEIPNVIKEKKQMKDFVVTFEEVIVHEFDVPAESFDTVNDEFETMADAAELDFSDGYVVGSKILRISCPDDNLTEECSPSAADLERLVEIFKRYIENDIQSVAESRYVYDFLRNAGANDRDIELLDFEWLIPGKK